MRHFLSDRKGNVAVLFALAVVPVIGGLGAAIDYSTANSYRTDMQKALDATALALSKIIPLPQAQLDAVGTQYFKANLGYHDLTDLKLIVTPEQGKVKLRASGNYTPKLANLFGATQFEVGAEAEAHWSMGKVEIALVLDNSGSMTDHGRMAYLKESAHDLLEVLETAAREP